MPNRVEKNKIIVYCMNNAVIRKILEYKGLFLALIVASALILFRLGDAYFWADEAQTATLSYNTLSFGYPRVWDGKNLLTHTNGKDFNMDFAYTENPWLQFYLCALSLYLFGKTSLAGRIPFAIFGILSIFIIWKLGLLVYRKKSIASLASLTMSLFVPFLLYSRQCRYYSLAIFFTLISTLYYFKLLKGRNQGNDIRRRSVFALLSAALLLSNYLAFFIWGSAVITHLLLIKARVKKILYLGVPIISGILIGSPLIVYLFANNFSYAKGFTIGKNIVVRMLISLWKVQTYFVPFISIIAIIILLRLFFSQKHKKRIALLGNNGLFFLLLIVFNILFIAIPDFYIMNHYMLTTVAAVPFILASVSVYFWRMNRPIALFFLILCLGTNVLHILPYIPLASAESRTKINSDNNIGISYLPSSQDGITVWGLVASPVTEADCRIQPLDKYLSEISYKSYPALFLDEITHKYSNTAEEVVKILNKYGHANENVLARAIEYEYIGFYTDMRVVNRLTDKFYGYGLDSTQLFSGYQSLIKVPDGQIDWVISSKYGDWFYESILTDPDYFKKNIEYFEILQTDINDLYLSNSPDLDIHVFIPDKNAPKLEIMHRKNTSY